MRIIRFETLMSLPLLLTMLCCQAAPSAASDNAQALFVAERYQAAIQEADRVLAADPTDSEALNIKARAVSVLGDDRSAIRLVTQALDYASKDGTASVTELATYWNNLGYFNERQRNFDTALQCYEKSLNMRVAALGANDLQTADSYNNLGTTLSKLGRHAEAFANLRKSLALRQRLLGDQDPTVAIALNNLGNAYYQQGDYRSALPLFQQALAIDMALHGPAHPTVAIRWNNIGDAYRGLGQYDQAELFLNKALASDLATFGENHPKVILRYSNLARVYEAQGDRTKASAAYTKALQIVRHVDPDDAGQIHYLQGRLQALQNTPNPA